MPGENPGVTPDPPGQEAGGLRKGPEQALGGCLTLPNSSEELPVPLPPLLLSRQASSATQLTGQGEESHLQPSTSRTTGPSTGRN